MYITMGGGGWGGEVVENRALFLIMHQFLCGISSFA